jgi:hypothetical protein
MIHLTLMSSLSSSQMQLEYQLHESYASYFSDLNDFAWHEMYLKVKSGLKDLEPICYSLLKLSHVLAL